VQEQLSNKTEAYLRPWFARMRPASAVRYE